MFTCWGSSADRWLSHSLKNDLVDLHDSSDASTSKDGVGFTTQFSMPFSQTTRGSDVSALEPEKQHRNCCRTIVSPLNSYRTTLDHSQC
jgi:hypothetical protein